jgi:hypothetical protein
MPWTTGDRSEKVLFVACNLALAAVWLLFLIRLISRWNILAANIRDATGLFMMFFSFLWLTLIRGKRGFIPILMAGAVLVTVYEIVSVLR